MVDGVGYDCNERFYVCGKAEFADDHDAIKTVMSAKKPKEVKRLSQGLNRKINMNEWMDTLANKVMLDGVKVNFCQNPHLKEYLVKTGKRVLVGPNPRDTYWSSGLITRCVRKLADITN